VQRGRDVTKTVLETLEEWKAAPGAIVPIAAVPDVPVSRVTVEGQITEQWAPSSPATAQVGRSEVTGWSRIEFPERGRWWEE